LVAELFFFGNVKPILRYTVNQRGKKKNQKKKIAKEWTTIPNI